MMKTSLEHILNEWKKKGWVFRLEDMKDGIQGCYVRLGWLAMPEHSNHTFVAIEGKTFLSACLEANSVAETNIFQCLRESFEQ